MTRWVLPVAVVVGGVLGRSAVYRNATSPLRESELICASARFVGDKMAEDMSDATCRIICSDDCWLYHTPEAIGKCLHDREALNCLYEWWEGHSIEGRGCADTEQGYYPLVLDETDAEFGLYASMASRGVAWAEVNLHSNVEKAGNSDCINDAPGYFGVYPYAKVSWDSYSNACVAADGVSKAHFQVSNGIKEQTLVSPLIRHDYSGVIALNITDWLARTNNVLEAGTLVVLQANTCWGTFAASPGRGGLIVQHKRPHTSFRKFVPSGYTWNGA